MAQYMSGAQKRIGSITRGDKHQILIDRAVNQDCKTRQTDLSTTWIDYKRVYESMPHTWILECLELHNTKSLHQELNEAVENDPVGQLKANCTRHQQVQHLPRWSR